MIHAESRVARIAAVAALLGMLAGCGHMPRWPWTKTPPAPPEAVHELDEAAADGAAAPAFAQYWKRNTLVIDLRSAGSTGNLTLKPREGTTWPVRIAFRVTPGAIGVLEVHADQRMILPVTPQGTRPVDLELAPGVYTPKTGQITVVWAPATTPPS